MIIEIAVIDSLMDDLENVDANGGDRTPNKESETLEKILERINPILEVAAYEIPKSCYLIGSDPRNAKWTYFSKRGLKLIDNFSKKHSEHRATFLGSRLILFQDSSLVRITRLGGCELPNRERASWWTNNTEELNCEEAVRRYGLKKIVEGLTRELRRKAV
jgi:hypothetical protein